MFPLWGSSVEGFLHDGQGKSMKKFVIRSGISLATVAIVIAGAAAFSAYEAHVVNVTATIENALSVDTGPMAFGMVFPQEYMTKDLNIGLSNSFLATSRVDDIEYVIKQKPMVKGPCVVTESGIFGIKVAQALEPISPCPGDPYANIEVGNFTGPAWQYCEENLPQDWATNFNQDNPYWTHCFIPLSNYLSKHGSNPQDTSVDAFHQAYIWSGGKSLLDPAYIAGGRLSKQDGVTSDKWTIDLAVPCFQGECAQDWASFVHKYNEGATPADFILPQGLKGKTFGTQLWVEVTGVSLSPNASVPIITTAIHNSQGQVVTSVSADSTVHDSATVTGTANTTPSFGAASTYSILSSTYTNTTAGTTVNGDIGFTTGPAVVPTGTHTNYGSGAPYSTAGTNQGSVLSNLASQPCTFTFANGPIDLATDTTHGPIGVYTPGVYCTGASSAASIGTAGITLSGSGTYIFRVNGALTTVDSSHVTLAGASACDVFWTPTAATTLGSNSTFVGTNIDASGITVGANTNWTGRALAFGGTVSTDTDTIAVPTCAAPGTVNFTFYTNGICEGPGTAAGSHVLDSSGIADPSNSQGPLSVGSYSFKAHYNGDGNHSPADSACEPLTVN